MNAQELREKGQEELKKLLLEFRREQFNLRMQRGSGQPVRSSRIKSVRRDIARVKTVLRQKRDESEV